MINEHCQKLAQQQLLDLYKINIKLKKFCTEVFCRLQISSPKGQQSDSRYSNSRRVCGSRSSGSRE